MRVGDERAGCPSVRDRFTGLPGSGLEEGVVLQKGTIRDYERLCEHHYKSARPATVTRVLVLRHRRRGVAGRFLQRGSEDSLVGVLVESLPSLNCRMRDWALDGRYGGLKVPGQRAAALTRELRCISRVIVHPQWRGLGMAVRLVRAVLEEPATVLTEAIAAMGSVCPFFERAGMRAYHRPPHAFDRRLCAAMTAVGIRLIDLANLGGVLERVEALGTGGADRRAWFLGELRRWYRRTRGRKRDRDGTVMDQLKTAQERLLCEPVYFLKVNGEARACPDHPMVQPTRRESPCS